MSDDAGRDGRISALAQEAITPLCLVVDDVTVTPAGKRRVVRIAVDDDLSQLAPGDTTSRVPAVDLDRIADATRAISSALDEEDLLGQAPYVLEVTSPGVSRPLVEPRHFRRNVGRLVSLHLTGGGTLEGRVIAADDAGVTLHVEGTKDTPAADRTLPYGEIDRAGVRVEFSRDEPDGDETPDVAGADDADDADDAGDGRHRRGRRRRGRNRHRNTGDHGDRRRPRPGPPQARPRRRPRRPPGLTEPGSEPRAHPRTSRPHPPRRFGAGRARPVV